MTARPSTPDVLLMCGVMATLLVGNLLSSLSPMYIGALMQSLAFSEADAGLVMSVELICIAAALTLLSRRLAAVPPFRLAIVGTAVVVAAQVASAFTTTLAALLAARAVSGVGASCTLLAASMLIARRADPDRYIAIAMVGTSLVFAVVMALCGVAIDRFGIAGFYVIAAATAAASLPLFLMAHRTGAAPNVDPATHAHAAVSGRSVIVIAFVLGIMMLTFVGQAAWSFAQRSGANAGIAVAQIGGWLAGSNVLTVLGSVFAAWMSSRITSIVPLLIGVLTTGLTCAVQVGAQSSPVFEIPVLLNGLAFGFSTPFIFGAGARLDRGGTVVAYLNSSVLFTQAATPVLAGTLIEQTSYQWLGFALGALTLLAAGLIIPACVAARTGGRPSTPPSAKQGAAATAAES